MFYFDFRDPRKQNTDGLLLSILSQLSSRALPRPLELLYEQCHTGRRAPNEDETMATIETILLGIPRLFIVLDALDECGERLELMDLIKEMSEWNPGAVSILATSRREHEIEEEIMQLQPTQVNIQSSLIDSDIRAYIQTRLEGKGRLRRWCRDEKIKSKIQQALVEGAKGM